MTVSLPPPRPPVGADLVQSLEDMVTATGLSTYRAKQLPPSVSSPPIPARTGKASSAGAPV
jgi:hypothetical protein